MTYLFVLKFLTLMRACVCYICRCNTLYNAKQRYISTITPIKVTLCGCQKTRPFAMNVAWKIALFNFIQLNIILYILQ